jgi:hypothetical protein
MFNMFLDAVRPVYPTVDTFDIKDKDSIDRSMRRYLDELSQVREKQFDRIVEFARYSGCYTSVADVRSVLNRMIEKGIQDSNFETVFRRWRDTKASSIGSVSRRGVTGGWRLKKNADTEKTDITSLLYAPLITFSHPSIVSAPVKSWEDHSSSIEELEEFEKAIRWVRRRDRKLNAKALWGKWIHSLPKMSMALLSQLFWTFLPWGVVFTIVSLIAFMWKAVSLIHWGILWQYAGMAIGITAGVDLLIWGFVAMSTSGGSAIDHSHEWRMVTRNGRPGGRVGPATMKDLYEHTHGHGSWERRNTRRSTTGAVLASLTVVICPLCEIPFLLDSGVQGIGPIVGYYLIYPLLPLAVIGGLIYWLFKISPPLNIR